MDLTSSEDASVRPKAVGRDLPVDPDVTPAERVPASTPRRRGLASGERRRAEPRVTWSRLLRALVRHRDVLAVIAVGGALGSLARWWLAEVLPYQIGEFPWATFITNVSGCFLIGLLMVFVIEVWPPSRYVRPFLGVGILGGYTTFSTYVLDTRALLVSGAPRLAAIYMFGSLAAGFAAVWLAVLAARGFVRLTRRRGHRRRTRGRAGRPSGSSRRVQGDRESGGGGATETGSRPVDESERASRRT